MKIILSLLCASVAFGQAQGVSGNYAAMGNISLGITSFSHPTMTPAFISGFIVPSQSGGDTQFFTWTNATTKAGNWPGPGGSGAIVGTYNDGGGFGCPIYDGMGPPNIGASICVYEITAYDSTAQTITTALVNSMDSYGGLAYNSCYDTSLPLQMKSRKPFAFDGAIFLPIFCMEGPGGSFHSHQSGIIVSPPGDAGAHWCNFKSFNTITDCTAANWQANGDNPVDAAGFQWPLADGTSKMTRMMIVDFLCQDNSTGCASASGVDSSYLYFISSSNPDELGYLTRVPKSVGWKGIMNPANFQAYQSGSWTSTLQNATAINGGAFLNACCSGIAFHSEFGVFAAWIHVGTNEIPYATAPAPWGPWTNIGTLTVGGRRGFPSPIAGLCPTYGTPGHVRCTISTSPAADLGLNLVDLGVR